MFIINWNNSKTNRSGKLGSDGVTDFVTSTSAQDFIDTHPNFLGKFEEWKLNTDGTHTEFRTIKPEVGDAYNEYFFPSEYTFTIEDITEAHAKKEARNAILDRRASKKQLASNIMDILNDHIEQLNLSDAQEDMFDTAVDSVMLKLQKGRPDKIKSLIENKDVGQIFTQELKTRLLEEFVIFEL